MSGVCERDAIEGVVRDNFAASFVLNGSWGRSGSWGARIFLGLFFELPPQLADGQSELPANEAVDLIVRQVWLDPQAFH